ncbi:MAG TPA: DUF1697 domain-containing protein [Terriglobia bacterium]|nr:DUF1697 domain-containing protein [Terriglobia bacterium]
MTQVVFLRGVNVGGHKTFQPSILAKQLKDCDIVNIGAAGTFVVRNPISQTNLRAELLRRLPFEAEIMICSGREIINAAAGNPFVGQPSGPDIVWFVSVLAKRPRSLPDLPLSLPPDKWLLRLIAIQDRFAFGLYRRQMRAISCLSQLEKRLGMPVTTRNWNTITSIIKVLKPDDANSE